MHIQLDNGLGLLGDLQRFIKIFDYFNKLRIHKERD